MPSHNTRQPNTRGPGATRLPEPQLPAKEMEEGIYKENRTTHEVSVLAHFGLAYYPWALSLVLPGCRPCGFHNDDLPKVQVAC